MNVVLVIDMLRGFMERGYPLYCGDETRKIIPNIQKLLKQEEEKGSILLFISDRHESNDLEFKMFPPHCIAGTEEAAIIPEVSDFITAGTVVPKNRYSGFHNTILDRILDYTRPIDKLIVCGVCTDICVMHTVADARNRDYEVEVPVNCVASFNNLHHGFALIHMEKVLGAKLTKVA